MEPATATDATGTTPAPTPDANAQARESDGPFDPAGLREGWSQALRNTGLDTGKARSGPASVQTSEKRRPGRPRGGANKGAAVVGTVKISPDRLATMAKPLFRIACDAVKVERVSDLELKEWADACAPFADRVLAKWMNERADAVAAVIATLALALPRISQYADSQKRAKAQTITADTRASF